MTEILSVIVTMDFCPK